MSRNKIMELFQAARASYHKARADGDANMAIYHSGEARALARVLGIVQFSKEMKIGSDERF